MISSVRYGNTQPVHTPSPQPQFGAAPPEEVAIQPEVSIKKKKGNPVLLLAVGGFMALWATLFVGMGVNFVRTWSSQSAVHETMRKDAVATVKLPVGVLGDILINKDLQLFARGANLGWIDAEGNAFTADGRKIGHADDQGNMYSILYPGQAAARLSENGKVTMLIGPNVPGLSSFSFEGQTLTLKQKAAILTTVAFHPDNRR